MRLKRRKKAPETMDLPIWQTWVEPATIGASTIVPGVTVTELEELLDYALSNEGEVVDYTVVETEMGLAAVIQLDYHGMHVNDRANLRAQIEDLVREDILEHLSKGTFVAETIVDVSDTPDDIPEDILEMIEVGAP